MKPIRVLVVDDQFLIRRGIRALLEQAGDFEIVAEASDGEEALSLVEEHRPHVVLMDISMPRMDGLIAARCVASSFPEVKVIVLSNHTDSRHVRQATRAGVAGYIVKDGQMQLAEAVRTVAAGNTYFSPEIAHHITGDASPSRPVEALTPRQHEILKLIAEGHSTKEIAQKLHISVKTAETHRTELMNRLDIHDVAGLVRYAIRIGLISSV